MQCTVLLPHKHDRNYWCEPQSKPQRAAAYCAYTANSLQNFQVHVVIMLQFIFRMPCASNEQKQKLRNMHGFLGAGPGTWSNNCANHETTLELTPQLAYLRSHCITSSGHICSKCPVAQSLPHRTHWRILFTNWPEFFGYLLVVSSFVDSLVAGEGMQRATLGLVFLQAMPLDMFATGIWTALQVLTHPRITCWCSSAAPGFSALHAICNTLP